MTAECTNCSPLDKVNENFRRTAQAAIRGRRERHEARGSLAREWRVERDRDPNARSVLIARSHSLPRVPMFPASTVVRVRRPPLLEPTPMEVESPTWEPTPAAAASGSGKAARAKAARASAGPRIRIVCSRPESGNAGWIFILLPFLWERLEESQCPKQAHPVPIARSPQTRISAGRRYREDSVSERAPGHPCLPCGARPPPIAACLQTPPIAPLAGAVGFAKPRA